MFLMENKLKSALVCTSMNQLGGKNIHLKNLYKYLSNKKIKLYIIGCSKVERDIRKFMLQEGVDRADLILLSRIKKWLILPFILELKKIFINLDINIVHTFQIQSDILGGMAARLAGIRHIVSQHESKIIEDNISLAKQLFYKLISKLIKNWFKKTIAVSEGLKKELVLNRFRAKDKIAVIHLGFDLPSKYKDNHFDFDKLKEGRPLIGTIARFSKEKGLDRFIMAIPFVSESIPQSRFIIFGRGEEKEYLLNLIKELNIDSKIILKDIPWIESIYDIIETFDIFVMPSVREGCPTALLEALALARPVVASDIEGIKDIIEDGKNGILVDTSNPQLFAEKIIFLCRNPEKAINFGEAGRHNILNNFTIEAEMAKIKKLYLEVLTK